MGMAPSPAGSRTAVDLWPVQLQVQEVELRPAEPCPLGGQWDPTASWASLWRGLRFPGERMCEDMCECVCV